MEMEGAYGRELQFMNFSVSLINLPQPSSGATCDYQGEIFLLIKPVSSVRIYFWLIRLQNFTFENVRPTEFKFDFTDNEVHAAGYFFKNVFLSCLAIELFLPRIFNHISFPTKSLNYTIYSGSFYLVYNFTNHFPELRLKVYL